MVYVPTPEQKARDAEALAHIRALLNGKVDQYVPQCLPRATMSKCRKYWQAGQHGLTEGQSFVVYRMGSKTGEWVDWKPGSGKGGGDMLSLICLHMFADNFKEAMRWAKSELGMDDKDPARVAQVKRDVEAAEAERAREAEKERKGRLARASALWFGSPDDPTPGIAGTPAEAYLRGRHIGWGADEKPPGSARYRPDVWCAVRQTKCPAMLLSIYSPEGTFQGVHRTYLDISGWNRATRQGPVRVLKVAGRGEAQRIWMPGEPLKPKEKPKSYKASLGIVEGNFIPIARGASGKPLPDMPEGEDFYVSEGYEDGRSWAVWHRDARVAAAVSLSNMGNIHLPPQAGRLVIIGQHDPDGSAAQETLERVVERQQERGVEVAFVWPDRRFKDMNEWLCATAVAA